MADTTEALVRAHIKEWDRPKLDIDRILDLFTDDAVWWDIPLRPAERKAAIRARPEEVVNAVGTSDGMELVRLVVLGDDVVITEAIDHFTVDGVKVTVPVCGVAQVRDGKIASWRDYWELRAYDRQVAQGHETS